MLYALYACLAGVMSERRNRLNFTSGVGTKLTLPAGPPMSVDRFGTEVFERECSSSF